MRRSYCISEGCAYSVGASTLAIYRDRACGVPSDKMSQTFIRSRCCCLERRGQRCSSDPCRYYDAQISFSVVRMVSNANAKLARLEQHTACQLSYYCFIYNTSLFEKAICENANWKQTCVLRILGTVGDSILLLYNRVLLKGNNPSVVCNSLRMTETDPPCLMTGDQFVRH